MAVFFWCGITFLLFYRICTLIFVVIFNNKNDDDDEFSWWDVLLVILDVYIFKAVYLSFRDARQVIDENIKARAKKKNASQTTSENAGHIETREDSDVDETEDAG